MSEIITMEQLLNGKQYRRGGSLFPSTRELVEPFIENIRPYVSEFRIKVVKPDEGTAEEEVLDDTFKRVLVEGFLADQESNHKKVIAMIYGLDTQNPLIKVYSGWENQACMNLSVFNPRRIQTVHLNNDSYTNIYLQAEKFAEELESEIEELKTAIKSLKQEVYSGQSLNEKLGILAKSCLVNQGLSSSYSNMVNFLENRADKNGIRNIYYNNDKIYTGWDIYEAMTCTPSHKSFDASDDVLKIYRLMSPN